METFFFELGGGGGGYGSTGTEKMSALSTTNNLNQGGGVHGEAHRADYGTISG